jgi:WD40 repeat protein
VNAVAYLDGASPHLLVSGSDDFHVRLWDIRDKRGGMRQPTGVLVGGWQH